VSTSVANKQRDIAIMRSMGFSAADLERIFVIEGFALACVGVVAGWALGFALMQVLGSLEFPIQGRVEKLPLDRSFFQYAVSAMASLSSAVIAAWIPARKAARVDPVDILRGAV
jgi:lipoprotein-releasing system permease protein